MTENNPIGPWLVIQYGGAALDQCYKDPGTMEVHGPYTAHGEAEAVSTLLTNWAPLYGSTPTCAEVISIDSLSAFSVESWISETIEYMEVGDGPEDIGDDRAIAALDLLMPNWRTYAQERLDDGQ